MGKLYCFGKVEEETQFLGSFIDYYELIKNPFFYSFDTIDIYTLDTNENLWYSETVQCTFEFAEIIKGE